MPELPEVETVRRGLVPAMENKTIQAITLNRTDLRVPIDADFKQRLEGATVKRLIRRGKYVLVFTEKGDGFVLHLGMSGRVHIYMNADEYIPAKHDHVIWDMSGGTRIVLNDPRRFGMLYLTRAANWENEKPFNGMGPEPLGNAFSGDALYKTLKNRRGPIKVALLDQRVVSGVGNIYACEALYDCGIHPERPSNSLSEDETVKLAASIRVVLEKAIEAGGSTLKDYAKTDGTLGYFQHSFSVYDRAGESCGAQECVNMNEPCVQKIVQGGRSTFFCKRKQR